MVFLKTNSLPSSCFSGLIRHFFCPIFRAFIRAMGWIISIFIEGPEPVGRGANSLNILNGHTKHLFMDRCSPVKSTLTDQPSLLFITERYVVYGRCRRIYLLLAIVLLCFELYFKYKVISIKPKKKISLNYNFSKKEKKNKNS